MSDDEANVSAAAGGADVKSRMARPYTKGALKFKGDVGLTKSIDKKAKRKKKKTVSAEGGDIDDDQEVSAAAGGPLVREKGVELEPDVKNYVRSRKHAELAEDMQSGRLVNLSKEYIVKGKLLASHASKALNEREKKKADRYCK